MFRRLLVLLTAAGLGSSCTPDSASPAPPAAYETEVRLDGRADLFIRPPNGGDWINLTRFDRPRHILDHALSPDGQWIFVVHVDYAPARLSVFQAATGQPMLERSLPDRAEPRWSGPARLKILIGDRVDFETDFPP